MGRPVSSNLQALLDLPDVETQTTLYLQLIDETEPILYLATDDVNVGSQSYVGDLRTTGELKQSILAPPDRVNTVLQNVDRNIGAYVFDEVITNGVAKVGRLYRDPDGILASEWVELFQGSPQPTSINETELTIEVLHDLVAAGFCVGDWSLAPNCQFVFKQSDTCGYAGGLTSCNHRRNSPGGCFGRANEHHYGGMEANESTVPGTPGGDPDPDPPPYPQCPRLDQWLLVRGMDGNAVPKLVGDLTDRDWLFHPIAETFHKVRSAKVIKQQQIVRLVAENMAVSYSSPTHRVIRDRDDVTGTPIEVLNDGQSVLTWKKDGLQQSSVMSISEEKAAADVCEIEMEDGHIYCAGHAPNAFVAAHNRKPVEP